VVAARAARACSAEGPAVVAVAKMAAAAADRQRQRRQLLSFK